MKHALPLAFLVLLAGCASGQEELALRGQKELVGLSEQQLLSCAGEPTARNRENGVDLLSYFRESSAYASMNSGTDRDYSPLSRPGGDYEYFRYCETTFALRQGRVTEVAMKGRTATGRETLVACGQIVARCLKAK
ncbi:hypothetical protein [Ferrovibrio sp.]|uniref:hypothetical protein n=1 Tax=Ferrovibrio sp. TaxID=1917215 RepID=UPI003D0CCD71